MNERGTLMNDCGTALNDCGSRWNGRGTRFFVSFCIKIVRGWRKTFTFGLSEI